MNASHNCCTSGNARPIQGLAVGFAHDHGDWMRRDSEPPPRLEIVELEPDIGVVERDVGTALDVGRAAAWIIDRLAIDGDVHHIQIVWALRTKFLGLTCVISTPS